MVWGQSSNPVNADIVVALDGTGDFTKIQDAINAVESNIDRQTIIYVRRGLYNTEKIIIPSDKKNISLVGESRDETIISYHIYDCADGKCPVTDAALWSGDNIRTSATLTIQGDGFRAENLTLQNTAGPVGQAQAITVQADKIVFKNCNIEGYQDTIYIWTSGVRTYFKDCLITGRTDYIYGSGIGFFESCEVRSWGGGWITAPATPQDQKYGFVFANCNVGYAENSPRAGDDGNYIRLGRPWHEYPKVSWLYCQMTEKIHPEGWGDTWSMEYAATSDKLELYEYKNTGQGADMSSRANWAGIRALTDAEALNYTALKVMAGADGWDPTKEVSLVQTYNWTGNGTDNGWLNTANWNPASVPGVGESATVNGNYTIVADGGTFAADLSLKNSAKISIVSNSTVNYLSASGVEFLASNDVTLAGKIATKDSLVFNIDGNLNLRAQLSGVHKLIKKGSGKLILSAENKGFSGTIIIEAGTIEAAVANSLGNGNVKVSSGGILEIKNEQAFLPDSKLEVENGGLLTLNANLTTSEFFIDNEIQPVGVYTALTNPGLISGLGQLIIGRPSSFNFIGGVNGNWDNPAHFSPALLPEEGETVNCSIEMETTSTVFKGNIHLTSPGNLRLRGEHSCTGTITMDEGTNFRYSTGGAGFSLNAPIVLAGNVKLIMESQASPNCTMTIDGSISGSSAVKVINNGRGTLNTGTVILKGDNSGFTGIWDLSSKSEKYPNDNYISAIEGQSANSFGKGTFIADYGNKIIFSNAQSVGNVVEMTLHNAAKALLNADLQLKGLKINGVDLGQGVYSATSHPQYFEGTGKITVAWATSASVLQSPELEFLGNILKIQGTSSDITIYSVLGVPVFQSGNKSLVDLSGLKKGIYLISYVIDGTRGSQKFLKR